MSFTRERIDEIIDQLRGTALKTSALLEDYEDEDDPALLIAIDDEIFQCPQCGWWEDRPGRESDFGEDICNDCHNHKGEAEDDAE